MTKNNISKENISTLVDKMPKRKKTDKEDGVAAGAEATSSKRAAPATVGPARIAACCPHATEGHEHTPQPRCFAASVLSTRLGRGSPSGVHTLAAVTQCCTCSHGACTRPGLLTSRFNSLGRCLSSRDLTGK